MKIDILYQVWLKYITILPWKPFHDEVEVFQSFVLVAQMSPETSETIMTIEKMKTLRVRIMLTLKTCSFFFSMELLWMKYNKGNNTP